MAEKYRQLSAETQDEGRKKRNRSAFDTIDYRFSRWLVSNKLAACPRCSDGLEAICPTVMDVTKTVEEDTPKRKLLDVEEARLRQIEAEEEIANNRRKDVSRIYNRAMIERVEEKLKDSAYTVNETLRLPRITNDLINLLFSPSVAFRRIGDLIGADKSLTDSVMTLINSEKFSKYIGKDLANTTDPGSAIGKLGIPGSQYIVPMMLLKPKVPMGHGVRSRVIENKLWAWVLYSVNCSRILLRSGGYGDDDKELEGVILGGMRILGYIAIYREFCRVAGDVKYDCLTQLREERELYDAMVTLEPNFNVLPHLFREIGKAVTFNIVDQFEWDSLPRVKRAFEEERDLIPIHKRSIHGAVLGQVEAYVMFDMLRKAKMIKKDEIMPSLHHVYMPNQLIKDLLPLEMGNLDFREYIG